MLKSVSASIFQRVKDSIPQTLILKNGQPLKNPVNHYFQYLQEDLNRVLALFPKKFVSIDPLEQSSDYYHKLYSKLSNGASCSSMKKYSVADFLFDTKQFQVIQYVCGFECEYDSHGSHYWHLAAYMGPHTIRGGAGYDNRAGILVVLARNDGWTTNGENASAAPYKIGVYFNPLDKAVVDQILESCKVAEISESPKISCLCRSQGGFYYKETDVIKSDFDFANYNEDFSLADEALTRWADKQESCGLVILHGKPGTGKTYYLRHLAGRISNLTYIPSGIAHEIGNPDFISFLSENPNRVFIIEDAEGVLVSDGNRRSSALQNLLNATDGLMGDIIKSKFIFTFNTDLKNIDKALLRPGRASLVYEFKELAPERTAALCEKLGREKVKASMTLAEIYNAEVVGAETINREKGRIGF